MISALAISHRLTAIRQKCVGQELNLQARRRVGYSHLSTPMLSQRVLSRETGDWSKMLDRSALLALASHLSSLVSFPDGTEGSRTPGITKV